MRLFPRVHVQPTHVLALFMGTTCPFALLAQVEQPTPAAQAPLASSAKGPFNREFSAGKQAMAEKHFAEAELHFRAAVRDEPKSIPARMGVADAELALHRYEAAERDYRAVVAQEPQTWVAHKNLVIVEAALSRWEEFDRERAVLRTARQLGEPGISTRESDVIDGFDVAGEHWIVREYFEPVGRSQARYNFELFAPEGRVEAYVSLEHEQAAESTMTAPGAVAIGGGAPLEPAAKDRFVLNWYTGHAHGTVHTYGADEPSYERVRADVLAWLRIHRMQRKVNAAGRLH